MELDVDGTRALLINKRTMSYVEISSLCVWIVAEEALPAGQELIDVWRHYERLMENVGD